MSEGSLKVGVFGAGAVGTYLGLRLAAARSDVTLVGRPWLAELAGQLSASDLNAKSYAPNVRVETDVATLGDVDVCLVCVKSGQTSEAAEQLAQVLRPGAVVVSFQNGLCNPGRLREHLKAQTVVPGMVSFNVVIEEGKCFRQATSGPLSAGRVLGSGQGPLERLEGAFNRSGLPLELHHDIGNLQAGKLLVNLNNGLSAATGLTIKQGIASLPLRRCFAACVLEGLDIFQRTGLRPAKVVALPPALMARLMPLPNPLFLRVARSLVTIDPRAKSSTLQDLERGRPTEIEDLNGEVLRRAASAGLRAPVNQVVYDVIRSLEAEALAGKRLSFLSPSELWGRVQGRPR